MGVPKISILVAFFVLVFGADLKAEEVWEKFSGFDESSNIHLNHKPLTDILQQVVLPVGRSKTLNSSKGKVEQYVGSKIRYGNYTRSRTEGNRLFIHAFEEGHKDFFRGYQVGLENVSNRIPLENLSRDEQLAFWLNLYNVIVINKLIEEYPVQRLEFFRKGKRGKPAFVDQKITEVEGVPLSLRDIERILFKNWDTPLVIYGLYQGAIGGPSLSNQAFNSDTVWKILTKSGTEFVNSNRGVRPQKKYLEISLIYDWFEDAFPGTGYSILSHIHRLADPGFLGDITGYTEVKAKYYDWVIADMLGGVLHTGMKSTSTLIDDSLFRYDPGRTNTLRGLPPQALELLQEIVINNDIPRFVPIITTEECAPGEDCSIESLNIEE